MTQPSLSNPGSPYNDPFVRRRMERKEAKADYKAAKTEAKEEYRAAKKEANAELKASGATAGVQRNTAVESVTPSSTTSSGK